MPIPNIDFNNIDIDFSVDSAQSAIDNAIEGVPFLGQIHALLAPLFGNGQMYNTHVYFQDVNNPENYVRVTNKKIRLTKVAEFVQQLPDDVRSIYGSSDMNGNLWDGFNVYCHLKPDALDYIVNGKTSTDSVSDNNLNFGDNRSRVYSKSDYRKAVKPPAAIPALSFIPILKFAGVAWLLKKVLK